MENKIDLTIEQKLVIGFILILVTSTAVYFSLGDTVRMRVDDDKTVFYVKDSRWLISGIEQNRLFNGTKIINRVIKSISNNLVKSGNKLIRTRNTTYSNGAMIVDTYVFEINSTDIEKFPVEHKVELFNAKGLFYRYSVDRLQDTGDKRKLVNEYELEFGYNMKVELENDYRWAWIGYPYGSDSLAAQYDIDSDYEVLNFRLYDPYENLKFIRSEIDLFDACSYYKIDYLIPPTETDLYKDLESLKIDKINVVSGKLNNISISIKLDKVYYVNTTDYSTCYDYSLLASYNNTKYCSDVGLKQFNDTHCIIENDCIIGYHIDKESKDVWSIINNYGVSEKESISVLNDFNSYMVYNNFIKNNEFDIKICGEYTPVKTKDGFGVSIDHIPEYKDKIYSEYAWWNASWSNKKLIDITAEENSTSFQVLAKVDYESEMEIDFDDIRFVNRDENTSLSYWIINQTDSDYAWVYFKIDTIDYLNGTQAYLYYGNSGASSESSRASTMYFNEEWTSISGTYWNTVLSPAVSSGILILSISGNTMEKVYSKTSYGAGYALTTYFKTIAASGSQRQNMGFLDGAVVRSDWKTGGNWIMVQESNLHYFLVTNGDGSYVYSPDDRTNYHEFEIIRRSGTSSMRLDYVDYHDTIVTSQRSYPISYIAETWGATSTAYVDWCYIRKVMDVDPIVSISAYVPVYTIDSYVLDPASPTYYTTSDVYVFTSGESEWTNLTVEFPNSTKFVDNVNMTFENTTSSSYTSLNFTASGTYSFGVVGIESTETTMDTLNWTYTVPYAIGSYSMNPSSPGYFETSDIYIFTSGESKWTNLTVSYPNSTVLIDNQNMTFENTTSASYSDINFTWYGEYTFGVVGIDSTESTMDTLNWTYTVPNPVDCNYTWGSGITEYNGYGCGVPPVKCWADGQTPSIGLFTICNNGTVNEDIFINLDANYTTNITWWLGTDNTNNTLVNLTDETNVTIKEDLGVGSCQEFWWLVNHTGNITVPNVPISVSYDYGCEVV